MNFQLSSLQQQVQQHIHQLAQKTIKPQAADIDRNGTYPFEVKQVLSEHGYLGVTIPKEYGGSGLDPLSYCLIVEEVARVCASSSQIITVQELGQLPILLAGSQTQKQHYLPDLAQGRKIAAFALTEPGAGSDINNIKTKAERHGDVYVLNGQKRFISNAGVADVYSVFAQTEHGLTAFIVNKEIPGFSIGKLEEKMGMKGSPTGELLFDNCVVPLENRLGDEGQGLLIALKTLDYTRPGIGAQAVGIAQGALDVCRTYVREREQFGRPIGSFQAIQFMLADMATQIEAARSLVYRTASIIGQSGRSIDDQNEAVTRYASMAKVFASDVAMKVTTDAVQILGGYGYIKDFPVERMMRDAKVTQIYEGTNQIQRLIIARHLIQSS